MKTFHFELDVLYPEDPGVQIGDRVIIQTSDGKEVGDFVVFDDSGHNPGTCHDRCVASDDMCIRYNNNGINQPCIMHTCDGILKDTPDLEDL